MKGIVFTEFIEMIEQEFSFKMADHIIEESDLKSKGVYSSIGTYDHSEIFILVKKLSEATGISTVQLFMVYGEHLFSRFKSHYPAFFENVTDPLTFLELVDSYIHKQVIKLYPDAQLPSFVSDRIADNHLKMTYTSERGMSDFAHGLILGCFKNFGKTSEIEKEKVNEFEVVFNIKQLD